MKPSGSWLALCLGIAAAACGEPPAPPAAPADPLAPLRAFEAERRGAADFARLPASDAVLGPDPIAIRRVPGAPYLVSALRGRDAVVLLDAASLREVDRAPGPASPTGLAVTAQGEVLACGEASPEIFRYTVRGASLEPAGAVALPGLRGVRDLAVGPEGAVYALDERAGALLTLKLTSGASGPELAARVDEPLCAGPFRVERTAHHLIVDCLIEHALVVRRVGDDGRALAEGEVRVRHDGPIWGFAAAETEAELVLAAGGVEDHPLDRTGGSFGYIDSFAFLYRIATGSNPGATLVKAVNVSELGVITPKALHVEVGEGGLRAIVTGYGGRMQAELRFRGYPTDTSGEPEVTTRPLPPGTAAMAPLGDGGFVMANPLLDAWLLTRGADLVEAPARDDRPLAAARSAESRLGEALFFTSLMAPWNKSDGPLSRFTCETCHFEGYVDGRTHHTGRGDVRATTKPLVGLFNNRPHFSRALDPDLTVMVNAEFRVAGARSDHDPWFPLTPEDVSWMKGLDVTAEALGPEGLRRALMTFLMEFTHRPNPAALGRSRYTAAERAGAEVFRDRCGRCHAARLASDEPASAVPFERWEQLVFTREGPIVWGSSDYEKTGVTPYVHEQGARVPSLRRLYKKGPYFTNGSAKSLRDVLERARYGANAFFHDSAPPTETEALDAEAVEALLAFLDLL